MSARSAAGSKGAAAGSSADAAAASAQLSLSQARSNQRIGAAASAGKRHAGSAKQQAPASTSIVSPVASQSSLSGRKRAAAAEGSSSAAAASAAHSSKLAQSASSASQTKKQRREVAPNKSSSSAAAAVSSVGLDPRASPPRHSSRQPPPLAAHDLCVAAQGLIRGSLSFAESGVARFRESRAADIAVKAQQRGTLEIVLQTILALPAAERTAHWRTQPLQQRIAELATSLDNHAAHLQYFADVIRDARSSTAGPASASALVELGHLCNLLLDLDGEQQQPTSQWDVIQRWMLRVDALFTQLCPVVPCLQLSPTEAQRLLEAAVLAGAIRIVPALMRGEVDSGLSGCTINDECADLPLLPPLKHRASHEPILRLFEFGLDPVDEKADGQPALHLARNFVCTSLPAALDSSLAEMQTAIGQDEQRDAQTAGIPSLIFAHAIQRQERPADQETNRRKTLHDRFMHALIPAWLAHSTKVRALLLEAAPTRLIPPLVDVVARYLDLEGVPPARATLTEESAEMED